MKRIAIRLIRFVFGLYVYFDRSVRIAMNIIYFIRANVWAYGWYVNMTKACVRYGKLILKVWPIRHGYVLMRAYFRNKVRQLFGYQSASTYLLPRTASNG